MSRLFLGARRTTASLAQWSGPYGGRAAGLGAGTAVRTGPQNGAAVPVSVPVASESARGEAAPRSPPSPRLRSSISLCYPQEGPRVIALRLESMLLHEAPRPEFVLPTAHSTR